MKKIPVFVRWMVQAVEESCRKDNLDRVTVEELERIRDADADAEDVRLSSQLQLSALRS